MRISTSQMHFSATNALLDQQSRLSRTQLQVATGRRILTPADDPVASASLLDLKQTRALTERFQLNADAARARLALEESTLGAVSDALVRVRELAVQGNNDTLSGTDRGALAREVRQIVDQLLGLANTRDNNGDYLFAGYQGSVRPFAANGSGGFDYYGDDGTRLIAIGPGREVQDADSGTAVFRAIRNGNGTFATREGAANTGTGVIDAGTVNGTFVPDTYTITFSQPTPSDPLTFQVDGAVSGNVVPPGTAFVEGAEIAFNGVSVSITGTPADGDTFTVTPSANQDLFTTVQNLALALENPDATARHNAVNRVLADLDQAEENIVNVRTSIGARLNAIDAQVRNNEDQILALDETLSIIGDLDYAEAVSRLNLQLTGLQAAQQAFVRVQNLSLFNFLR